MNKWLVTLLAATVAMLGPSCGGATVVNPHTPIVAPPPVVSDSPAHAAGNDSASAAIGPAGGSLELTNGAKLEIPPGALAHAATVTLSHGATTDAFNNREDERVTGPTLAIAPALTATPGHTFVVSVPLSSIPNGFRARDAAVAFERVSSEQRGFGEEMGSTATRWDHGPASVSGQRILAQMERLPGFRVQFVFSR